MSTPNGQRPNIWLTQQVYVNVVTLLLVLVVVWNVLSLTAGDSDNLTASSSPRAAARIVDHRKPTTAAEKAGGNKSHADVPVRPGPSLPKHNAPKVQRPSKVQAQEQRRKCQFSNIDVHINVGPTSDEVAMYHLMMSSLDEFMPCVGMVHILFTRPEVDDKGEFKDFPGYNIGFPKKHPYRVWFLEDSFFKDFQWDKKNKHQYSRFTADLYAREEADFILFLDSDTLLAMPVTCRSIFNDEGKPLWFYGEKSGEWGAGSAGAIGLAEHVFGVKAYPPLAPKTMLPKLRKAMYDFHQVPYSAPFSSVFTATLKRSGSISEFNSMGNYMFNTTPEVFSAQKCPLQTDLELVPENKGIMCSWFPTAFLHFPYPLPAFRDNAPENFRSWDFFVAHRRWGYAKWGGDPKDYTKRAQDAVRWGSCWRRRWQVRKEGDEIVAEQTEKPAPPPPRMPEEEVIPPKPSNHTEGLPEPVKPIAHVVDGNAIEDAFCFGSDKFLLPWPECFHYTEGKSGVKFDGKKIAAYLLEETVRPWKGLCSEGRPKE